MLYLNKNSICLSKLSLILLWQLEYAHNWEISTQECEKNRRLLKFHFKLGHTLPPCVSDSSPARPRTYSLWDLPVYSSLRSDLQRENRMWTHNNRMVPQGSSHRVQLILNTFHISFWTVKYCLFEIHINRHYFIHRQQRGDIKQCYNAQLNYVAIKGNRGYASCTNRY